MTLAILMYMNLTAVVTEPLEIRIEPIGYVVAPTLHEVDLLIRDCYLLKHT